jgi:hypothetical protein
MKTIFALMVLATAGFVVAGCGSAKKAVPGSIQAFTGTTTVSNVKAGTVISCVGGASVTVPAMPLAGGIGASYGYVNGPSSQLELTPLQNGAVRVSCKG